MRLAAVPACQTPSHARRLIFASSLFLGVEDMSKSCRAAERKAASRNGINSPAGSSLRRLSSPSSMVIQACRPATTHLPGSLGTDVIRSDMLRLSCVTAGARRGTAAASFRMVPHYHRSAWRHRSIHSSPRNAHASRRPLGGRSPSSGNGETTVGYLRTP